MKSTSLIKFNDAKDAYIITIIFLFILFIKALFSLLELFTYGIFKKEILTEHSKLGFDIKIKMY
tara:strand:- start:475 stop:666 length:192 start_codon:yes stop_codon:yes gene_type:complete